MDTRSRLSYLPTVLTMSALAVLIGPHQRSVEQPVLVKDIQPGASSSFPGGLVDVNGTLFFFADDGATGSELWKSDGTTVLVKDINPGPNSSGESSESINVNGTLFFLTFEDTTGFELWKSDGTADGTVLVKDILPGLDSSTPLELTNVNGTLFFIADDGTTGRELWKSNGTPEGTVMIIDLNPGPADCCGNLTNVGGTLFFAASDGVTGADLWKSDGTAAGTVPVKDIDPGGFSSSPQNFADVGGTLFFIAEEQLVRGFELWKSDGTDAGTVLVKDIQPGVGSGAGDDLINVNGTLFFEANDGTSGIELWKSDGTAAGTVLVKDINPGPGDSFPSTLTNVNGTLFFVAEDGITGRELWKSDGTAAGTVLVKDILPGSFGVATDLTNVNGTLFFGVDADGSAFPQTELWKSDGTEAGTVRVSAFTSSFFDSENGTWESAIRTMTTVNGTLFLAADDAIHGVELWKLARDSDGDGSVAIDIKPDTFPNNWRCKRVTDGLPVAILGSSTFDATTIDADSVRFGKTGMEAAEMHRNENGDAKRHVADVNKDGRLDMVFHFRFRETGFRCSDIPAGQNSITLTGKLTGTVNGTTIHGEDSLRLLRN